MRPEIILSIIAIVLFSACEETISPEKLNLSDADSKYVIEATIHDGSGPYYVTVTKSTAVFENSVEEIVDKY